MPTNAAATGFWTAMPSGSRANNARQGRALLQAVYQNIDATPMNGTRSGVVPTTWDAANLRFSDLLVTVTSGLTMNVAPGSAVAHRSGQGPYEGWLTSAASVTTDPAPASNPRNDLVVMRWYDSTAGDASPDGNPCRIEIITGTPGAVPVDPITANSLGVYTSFPTSGGGVGIPLARAQVSTGGVITLTRLRRSVGVIGATRALLEGDSDTAGSVGDHRYTPSTDTLEVKNSAGNWLPIQVGVTGIVGAQVGYAEITANSATWNSATKVVTNLTTTFPAIAGAVYEVEADLTWACATASNTDELGIGWRLGGAGTVVNTDPIIGPRQTRTHPDGTGLNDLHLYGRFTAVSAGTHCVAVMGWKPTGNTGTSNLYATTASATNISTNVIRVRRVA
ncbi:hypothetical protein [Amycolatopsis sp. lyj-346]|uniref:hypothetical protein n=1 Tax=Amycolatopsis sp. lyj-346 TaxID=2789289 RepID=UPI00397AC5BB